MASNETKLGTAVIPVRAPLDELDKDLAEAKDKSEKAATGISGVLGKIKWAAVGAGVTALTGTLSDLAREGAADAASWQAVSTAVEGAGAQLDDTATSLAGNQQALDDLNRYLKATKADVGDLVTAAGALQKEIWAESGATKESAARKKELEAELKKNLAAQEELNKEYAKAEEELAPLTATIGRQQSALESMGVSQDEAEQQLSDYINKMRDLAAIGDDEMKPVLSGLISLTGDYQKSMELASLAADISRGKHINLQTAADLVNKVYQGNTTVLKRYGIVLDENATAEEALAALQKRFAGQAEAYGQTTQGQIEALSNRIGDFREDIGSAVNEVAPFIGMLPGLSLGFSGVGGAIGTLTPLLKGLPVALGPVGIAITAISAVVGLLALAWSNNWGDIQGKTAAAIGFLRDQLNRLIGFLNNLIRGWNSIEFSIPGFDVNILGRQVSWEGLHIDLPDIGTIPTIGGGGIGMGDLRALAAGGIVTRPTLAMVGEAGPEAVIPLDKAGRAVTVHGNLVQVNVNGTTATAGEIAQEAARAVLRVLTDDRELVLSGGVV